MRKSLRRPQIDRKAFSAEVPGRGGKSFIEKDSELCNSAPSRETTIAYSLMADAGRLSGIPRSLRHHGVNNGKMKKKMATAVITPDIGRFKKIISEP